MSCPILLCRPARSAAVVTARAGTADEETDTRYSRFLEWLGGDDTAAQFVRFVVVGSLSSAIYALLFWTLEGLGSQPANVVAATLSSMLANDLHRRLTFHADERLGWLAAQLEGGGVALVGIVASTLALGWLATTGADVALLIQLVLVLGVFATIGSLRFVALRWLFVLHPPHRA